MPRRTTRRTKLLTGNGKSITPDAPHCTLRPDIHEQLLKWAEEHFSAQAIADGLKEKFGSAPHRNTIYKEIRRHAPPGTAWTLADDSYDAASAQMVLLELAAVYHRSGGQRRHFTEREAWWIARLKSIHNAGAEGFTPLEPGDAFQMARLHVTAERRGEQLSPWMDVIEPAEARLHASLNTQHVFAQKEKRP